MFSKNYYKQFGEDIQKEVEEYDAYAEKKEISTAKCSHKNIKFVSGELRCKCGVAYTGPNLDKLYNLLTNDNI